MGSDDAMHVSFELLRDAEGDDAYMLRLMRASLEAMTGFMSHMADVLKTVGMQLRNMLDSSTHYNSSQGYLTEIKRSLQDIHVGMAAATRHLDLLKSRSEGLHAQADADAIMRGVDMRTKQLRVAQRFKHDRLKLLSAVQEHVNTCITTRVLMGITLKIT